MLTRKDLRRAVFEWATVLIALALLVIFAPPFAPPLHAQSPVYIIPQTVSQMVFNAVGLAQTSPVTSASPCTPAGGGACAIPNLGQVNHIFTYTTASNSGLTSLDIRLEATNTVSAGNCTAPWFPISADATNPNGGQVVGYGWYACIRANIVQLVTSTSSTVTGFYLGTSTLSTPPLNFYNQAQQNRTILWNALSAGTGGSVTIGNNYGNAAGLLTLSAVTGTSLPSGSSLEVQAEVGSTLVSVANFNLPTSFSSPIQYYIPPYPATELLVSFNSGGTSTTTLNGYYQFYAPGQSEPYYNTHLTTAASTIIRNGVNFSHVLHTVTVNTAESGATATVFDSGTSGCASPVSTIAVIDASVARTSTFDTFATQSVCVTTTGSTPADITVTTQ